MQRKFNFAPDEYYHLYNRGNDKRQIFLDNKDYLRFLVLLYVGNSVEEIHISNFQAKSLRELFDLKRSNTIVDIGVHCLMPNHFHLLVKEKTENGISRLMKKVLTGYSMYFNKKYQRTGKLFEGEFRATHADNDRYLRYLFAYIHLNPVKTVDPESWKHKTIPNLDQALDFLKRYPHSSFVDYWCKAELNRPEGKIINPQAFPEYFADFLEFGDFIKEWLDFSRQGESLTVN